MLKTTMVMLCSILFITILFTSKAVSKADKYEKIPNGNIFEVEFYCLFGVEYHMIKTKNAGKVSVLPAGPVWGKDGKVSTCDEDENMKTENSPNKEK